MMNYYNDNKKDFVNDDKNRVIDYYIFQAKPSLEDITAAKEKIRKRRV